MAPDMLDYQTFKLVHAHDGDRYPMVDVTEDVAAHDPERAWIEGERIFRCPVCDSEVVVVPPGGDVPDQNLG
jgi:hypothetical protein